MSRASWRGHIFGAAWGERVLAAVGVPRLARLINITVVVVLAASLAHMTWRVLIPPPVVAASPVPTPILPLHVLLDHHLFGVVPAARTVIPATHVALILTGVVAGGRGLALIGRAGHTVRPFRVGSVITPGVVLAAVTSDRAILRQRGRLESLPLYPPSVASVDATMPAALTDPVVPMNATATPARPLAVTIAPAVWSRLAQTVPGQIARWLKPGPAGGLVVQPVPTAVLRVLSLQAGDTIVAINGEPVDSLGTALAAYTAGVRDHRITITRVRRGRPRSLQYTLP